MESTGLNILLKKEVYMEMQLDAIKDFLEQWTAENTESFYEASRKLWESPELSMQEFKSSAVIMELLRENGFQVESGVAEMPTAFIATYGSGKPVIGVNAEYDALPGLSQDGGALEKKALVTGAPGQGCGHNLLGVAGAKGAIAIRYAMEKFGLSGTVKVFGTPAEELCLGKPFMGRAGCFDGVDAFLDWHPWSYSLANYDSCCAYFSVKYHFSGRTSHGNSPWHGRSALDAAMLQAHGVEMLREHIYPGCPPDAANTINYTFSDVGTEFPSVVPDRTTAWYIGRFITTADAKSALERVTNCAKGAALSTDTTVEVELITATNHKIPNKTLAQVVHDNFQRVGAPAFTEEEHAKAKAIQKQVGAPETGLPTGIRPFEGGYTVVCDTSEFSWNAPYASAWIAMGMENCGWHHWGVVRCGGDTMGQKSMDTAANVIGLSGVELLCKPEVLQAAQDEWKERLGGESYTCLIPDEIKPPVHLNEDVMNKYK